MVWPSGLAQSSFHPLDAEADRRDKGDDSDDRKQKRADGRKDLTSGVGDAGRHAIHRGREVQSGALSRRGTDGHGGEASRHEDAVCFFGDVMFHVFLFGCLGLGWCAKIGSIG